MPVCCFVAVGKHQTVCSFLESWKSDSVDKSWSGEPRGSGPPNGLVKVRIHSAGGAPAWENPSCSTLRFSATLSANLLHIGPPSKGCEWLLCMPQRPPGERGILWFPEGALHSASDLGRSLWGCPSSASPLPTYKAEAVYVGQKPSTTAFWLGWPNYNTFP